MLRRVCVGCLVLALFAGCVTSPTTATPTTPAPPTPGPAQPTARVPELPQLPPPDLKPLAGRRICIDPGHGDPWPGAVAPSNGLREADVNLRVALELARLVQGAGGNAVLTRTQPGALVPDNAAKDLAARAAVANDAQADAFVSVHHNADVNLGSERNDLEVFYRMGEDGASLDMAQALTYELSQRLRPDAAAKLLLPGNYKVLRECRVPAVLTESSYMTHSGNATLLAQDRATQAEALALAAGLARYFQLDPPRIAEIRLDGDRDGAVHAIVARTSGGAPLVPALTSVVLGGEAVPGRADFRGNTLRGVFADTLPNGEHRFELRVRNTRGAAASVPLDAAVNRPPARLITAQRPASVPADSQAEAAIEVRVLDALGLPVADGTKVSFEESGETVETRDGLARFYVFPRRVAGPLTFQAGPALVESALGIGTEPYRSLRVVDELNGRPVADAAVITANGDDASAVTTTDAGWAAVSGGTDDVTVARAGYEPGTFALAGDHTVLSLRPRFDGVFHGRRIALDAAYGGRTAGAIGPRGTRASDLNLDVVRRLAACLREGGADVVLTREHDLDVSDVQRVLTADSEGVAVLISISFGATDAVNRTLDETGHLRGGLDAFVAHYTGSANGKRLADEIATALGGRARVTPSAAYILQQPAATAVLVQPASAASPQTEDTYLDAAARQTLAEALCSAVAAYFRGTTEPGNRGPGG